VGDYSAKDVAALRKQTGAGMMDCKKALDACNGDVEKGKDWLREQGLAGGGSRAGRAAEQGAVEVLVEGDVAALVELSCETDFVAKGDDFRAMVSALARQVAAHGDADLGGQAFDASTVADAITLLSGKLGEKVELGRVVRYESADGILDGYKHTQNERGTIGVLVELAGVDPSDPKAREIAHDIALHIASAAPRYLTRDDVPADAIEKERSVLEALTRNEGKPENAIPKIVEGRLGGYFKQVALAEQPFVREPKTTVAKLLEALGAEATVRRFARVKVGEE
jgi:elongation factor Ts